MCMGNYHIVSQIPLSMGEISHKFLMNMGKYCIVPQFLLCMVEYHFNSSFILHGKISHAISISTVQGKLLHVQAP